ncbi:MAG: hypothetical protein QM638_05675 [Nocardioides sp.]|uniref:hypothetical protein n=1 Tax=Nocardioides sp. TaxID=35761 RepID=UPI0039E3117F
MADETDEQVEAAMGIFAKLTRRERAARRTVHELTHEQRAALPPRFEAAGEALAAGSPFMAETCWVAGRELAEGGVSLGESLEGLRLTTQLVSGRDPDYDEMHALSLAWSESTLGYLHSLSCADPLTGLATLAHLRERLTELYREARAARHALVVTDARRLGESAVGIDPALRPEEPSGDRRDPAGPADSGALVAESLAWARRLTLLGNTARSVFSSGATVGQVGHTRIVVLTPRDEVLPTRVSLLKRMTYDAADRVWIEGLPPNDRSAGMLLDELARGA